MKRRADTLACQARLEGSTRVHSYSLDREARSEVWVALARVSLSSWEFEHAPCLPQFCLHVGASDPVSFCCRAWMVPSFEGLQEAGKSHDCSPALLGKQCPSQIGLFLGFCIHEPLSPTEGDLGTARVNGASKQEGFSCFHYRQSCKALKWGVVACLWAYYIGCLWRTYLYIIYYIYYIRVCINICVCIYTHSVERGSCSTD